MAMKTTIKISLMAVMMAVMTLASCSSDEPADNKLTGEEMTEHIISVIQSHIEQIEVNEDTSHLFLSVADKEEAHKVCEEIINETWDGKNRIFSVPDNYGNIKIINETADGLYHTMVFDVEGLIDFQLQFCTAEYMDKNNAGAKVKIHCRKCDEDFWIYQGQGACPKCGEFFLRHTQFIPIL